ncbi:MAG: DNA replication and repair protein RecF [Bacteroidetes bacterium]|nr:MAG: DNA replication and repair protein RecF [Bacteroidota bacterium]
MKVQKLALIFFKNHSDFKLECQEDVVAIAGLNGVGKTTILDAIHYLCLGKSYFSSTDVQCIQTEELQAGIIAKLVGDEDVSLKVKFKRGGRKVIEKNGVAYKRVLEHIGQFLAVVIAPGDIELVYGSNETRRSFINQILSQVDRKHLLDLMKYNKLIEHRNKHLKQESVDTALLLALDEQIAPLALSIYTKRKEFLEEFCPVFEAKYHQLSGEKESVRLMYTSQLDHSSYMDLVDVNRNKDLAIQRSFVGIHRDELDIEIGDLSLRKFGSQGQVKSGLIALKLAEYEYLQKTCDKNPFLLLDDIFEKIDEERAQVLTQIIKNDNFGQIFITDTNQDRLNQFCVAIGKSYKLITLK